jgi:predicted DNA-binding transcriptional regulator YafY
MDRIERIYALHTFLDGRVRPVSLREIATHLECSPATAKRAIRALRTSLEAPLVYNRELEGYRYEPDEDGRRFQLPGVWLNADELTALATLRELVAGLEPGLLDELLSPLARQLERLASQRRLGLAEASHRLRVASHGARKPGPHFRAVVDATLHRRRLEITYHGRARDERTERVVSPQRLTRYRGSWYLDAWCHTRKGLRAFAVERILRAEPHASPAEEIPLEDIDAHQEETYGIFSGARRGIAVVRVTPERARWVAEETWHPDQRGRFLDDGRYELEIPYGADDELVLDLLRLGPDAEVVAPTALRRTVAARLRAAAGVYDDEK